MKSLAEIIWNLHLHAVGDFCTFYRKTVGAVEMEMRGISSSEKSVQM